MVEPGPSCVTDPILQLHLRDAAITTIIWATGFAFDFGWLQVGALDARGAPVPFLSRRASSFIFGVEQDAVRLAEHIAARG
jgi:putative flavoprotein involved in K+ transport